MHITLRHCLFVFVIYVIMSVPHAPSAEAAPCRIQPFGDSITAGMLPGGFYDGGYRIELTSNPPDVGGVQMVGHHYLYSPPEMGPQAWNSGSPGYRIDQLWGYASPYFVQPGMPQVILVHAGTNDILQFQGAANAVYDLTVLIDSLLYENYVVAGNRPLILVAKIIPLGGIYEGFNAEVSSFNSQIDNIVNAPHRQQYNIKSIDMNTGFDKVNHLGFDGIHPTALGYQVLANRWRNAINTYGCGG